MAEASEQEEEIQVSIVLEESPSKSSDAQTVRMIGFVMITEANMRLSELRLKINADFDDDQLEIIGNNFKFLKKTFPVSSKQEASMQIDKICIDSTANHDINTMHPTNHHKSLSFMLQPISPVHASPPDPNPPTHPQSLNNSLVISNEVEEKAANAEDNEANVNIDEIQAFESLPHHYQYISSHLGIKSPIMNTSFISNKGTPPDKILAEIVQNEEAFPKCTISPKQKTEATAYTVMIRACHRVLSRAVSDPNCNKNVALHSFLELDRENATKSLSVFTSFNAAKNQHNDHQTVPLKMSTTSSNTKTDKKAWSKVHDESHKQDCDDIEPSVSPKPIGFSKGTAATASFISSYPLSPKSTRLETQLGEKLPRIQAKSHKKPNAMDVHVSTEVDSILKNAMVKNTGYIVVDEDEATLMKEEDDMKIDENTEGSVSISVTEMTSLQTHKTKTDHTHKGDASLTTPPQLFWAATQRNNPFTTNKTPLPVGDQLVDDRIKTKFTVIGHPILKKKDDDEIDDDFEEDNENNSDHNVQLEFDNATDLIKGLGGVHHSKNNPLWIDMVCDRNNFINIAEHIRPAIHTLTIEDCLTIDCREKLEIFNEYLFICLKTWRHNDASSAGATHTINVLIFKTMIITFHLGHKVTSRLIADCRYILNKKFGNVCPSPSWVGHTIIDNVIDKMMPEVEARVREVETCEQFVFKLCNESQNELLHRMQNVRSWMVLYRSRLWPKSTITHNLLNNYVWRKDFLSDVPQPYWRDINDHAARMVDLLELGTQTLESIQNMFVAKVSLEMTQQSNNLASVGGKLAGVGAVFLPLTVITGIWGMNCRVPFQFNPEGDAFFDDNLYGFVVVMIVMALSSIITWQCVNRKGFVATI